MTSKNFYRDCGQRFIEISTSDLLDVPSLVRMITYAERSGEFFGWKHFNRLHPDVIEGILPYLVEVFMRP
jgi:hypothetical protein